LKKETALLVAKELTEKDALAAHVRDELGINDVTKANPLQAAFASGAAFTAGGALPLIVTILFPMDGMVYVLYAFAIAFLMILGAFAAKTGGSNIWKAVFRITFWGTIAMGLTALVGHFFGVNLA
jgi:VIT1/CCC1 family predicted Fe2+/Mn2+ transporter